MQMRGKEAFLLLKDAMDPEDKVRMALGMYALHRAVSMIRSSGATKEWNLNTLLRLWVRRSAEGSRAHALVKTERSPGTSGP